MPFATRLVTLSGECFEALFEREESAQPMRIGSYHLFRLTDIREGRGERLVSVFGPKQIKGEIEIARINAIRRAFDSGKLSFDEPYDEYKYNDGVELKDSDFGKQRQVSDSEIRQFLIHKAYWVGHMDSAPTYPVNFEPPEDLDYLGASPTQIRRNVLRLQNQGRLDKVMDGFGRATEKLISEYEAQKNEPDTEQPASVETHPSQSYRGILVFISHSSKDTHLALALIDLLKDAIGLTANQIRCSSVDGYRLPVGVNTESQLREEVNAVDVVIGLVTPSSLSSHYVMFELGARWGANRFVAPLLAGVKPSDLKGPLSLLNALDATNDRQLCQLVSDIAQRLNLPLQNAASYLRRVSEVKTLAEKTENQTKDSGGSVKPEQRQVGDTVYYFVGEQGPYCQPCFHNKGQLILLPPTRELFGGLARQCEVCGKTFFEKPRKPEHPQVRGSGGPNSWMR